MKHYHSSFTRSIRIRKRQFLLFLLILMSGFIPITSIIKHDNSTLMIRSSRMTNNHILNSKSTTTITSNIIYLESFNNTWLKENLSSHYSWNIDRISGRTSNNDEIFTVSLIHEPQYDILPRNGSIFQLLLKNILETALTMKKTNNQTTITSIDPSELTFHLQVALYNGSGFQILYSKELNIIGTNKGQWSETGNLSYGIDEVLFNFIDDPIFNEISEDSSKTFISLIKNLEELIVTGKITPITNDLGNNGFTITTLPSLPLSFQWTRFLSNLVQFLILNHRFALILGGMMAIIIIILLTRWNILIFALRGGKKIGETLKHIYFRILVTTISLIGLVYYSFQWHEKLKEEDVLSNKYRVLILRVLQLQKLAHFQYLKRTINCSSSVLTWHLNVLKNFGYIKSIRKGKYLIYYLVDQPPSEEELDVYLTCLNSKVRTLLKFTLQYPFLSTRDLVMLSGLRENTIRYHLKKLVKRGLLQETLSEKGTLFSISGKHLLSITRMLKQWDI